MMEAALTLPNEKIFDVVVARNVEGKLNFSKNAGFARMNEQEGYYTLRLSIFPRNCYFIVKNFSSSGKYTVFSKILHSDNGVKFQNPVGNAQLLDDLKTHLQIRFLMPRMNFFMSLFPKY